MNQTHKPVILLRSASKDGMDEFRLVKAVSKSVGSVTLSKALRLGILNCGKLMWPPNGMILLTPLTAEAIAELALATSF